MRKAIPMSALLAALLAVPAMAEGLGQVMITPEGAMMSDAADEAEQMQQLHRKITQEVQERLARELNLARVQFAQFAVPAQGQLMFAPGPVATEKAAYIGVATGAVPAVLRDQLKLHEGMGLVVLYVEKGSPAAEAGLHQNDVLEKLDDQLLVNGPQLAVLVRAKKPGETVTLSIIRGGERSTLNVKLAEKELPVMDDEAGFRLAAPGPVAAGEAAAGIQEGGIPWQRGVRKTFSLNGDGSSVRRLVNGEYDITLSSAKDGSATLLVKDRTGKEIYNAPYTTAKDKEEVPPEIAPLVKDLEQTGLILPGGGTSTGISASEISRVDARHRITLRRNGTEKQLSILEVDTGKVIYDGPADSDEVKKLPQEIQDKVKALMDKGRMQP